MENKQRKKMRKKKRGGGIENEENGANQMRFRGFLPFFGCLPIFSLREKFEWH